MPVPYEPAYTDAEISLMAYAGSREPSRVAVARTPAARAEAVGPRRPWQSSAPAGFPELGECIGPDGWRRAPTLGAGRR